MLGFEQTATGYRATDEQVAWWQSRDTCPACATVVEPIGKTEDGRWHYRHDCDGSVEWRSPVEWTCYSPADTA